MRSVSHSDIIITSGKIHVVPYFQGKTSYKYLSQSAYTIDLGQFKILTDDIRNNRVPPSLRFQNYIIDIERMRMLAEALVSNKTLLRLNFEGCDIKGDGVKTLVEALKGNTTLIELQINHCYISPNSIKTLMTLLQQNALNINSLSLIRSFSGYNSAPLLADILRKNTTLTTLNLKNNLLSDQDFQTLADALKYNTTLTSLDFTVYSYCFRDLGNQALANIKNKIIDNQMHFCKQCDYVINNQFEWLYSKDGQLNTKRLMSFISVLKSKLNDSEELYYINIGNNISNEFIYFIQCKFHENLNLDKLNFDKQTLLNKMLPEIMQYLNQYETNNTSSHINWVTDIPNRICDFLLRASNAAIQMT